MKQRVYIHTNNKQKLGAVLAKYAIESHLSDQKAVEVAYINVDELKLFRDFIGTDYLFSSTEHRVYSQEDLQSFTLSRFMPPELMGYEGKAIVIDPDIFALCNIEELFSIDLGEHALGACRKKDAWDTSVMLMDCSKLMHWNMRNILDDLSRHARTYSEIMTLKGESAPILELPRIWNSLDEYTKETKIIHMTGRLTQPWKTGLPIDFTRNKMGKIFGVIPREPIYKMLGKYQTHYQPHPNKEIEKLFIDLAKDAYQNGAITMSDVQYEIDTGHVRKDLLALIQN